MRRREFIALLGGAAAAWPLVARAQKSSSVRRVGVLMSTASDDSFGQANSAAFAQGLQQLGWEIGSNIRIDYRWGSGDTERFRKYAAELVGLSPDVILGTAASIVRALQEAKAALITAYIIIGHPESEGQNVDRSMKFAAQEGARVMLSEFAPIPGTPDGEACRAMTNLDEPLHHNKTAFTWRFLGRERVDSLKALCRQLNRERVAERLMHI